MIFSTLNFPSASLDPTVFPHLGATGGQGDARPLESLVDKKAPQIPQHTYLVGLGWVGAVNVYNLWAFRPRTT